MKKILLSLAMAAGIFGVSELYAQAEVTVVANADFTTLTQGSPESPVAFPSYGTGSFTDLYPSWTQSKTLQAGGQLLIQDNGYVRTPSANMAANNGTIKVTTRVKMMDEYGGCLKVSVGYSTSETIIYEDNEWHDVEMILTGGSSYSYVRVEPFLAISGMLVQNIKVEQSAAFIAAPVALQPNQADGSTFTARWKAVAGATGYYLDVYNYNADGEKVYLLDNQAVAATATSYSVTGLDTSKTYYFVVRAANQYGVSSDSNEIKVIKVLYFLDKPTNVAVNATENSFTATWDAVADAESYYVNVMQTRTLAQAEAVDMINEDFTKITSGALDGVDFIINPDLDPYTQTPGWEGTELGKAVGHLVLTPLGGADAYINTPAMDLSSDNGNCTVTVKMAQGAYGSFYSGGTVDIYVLGTDDNRLSEQTVTLGNGFDTYTVTLNGGTSNCRVGIGYSGSYKIFIDEIKVTQNKPAGSQITNLFCEEEVTDPTFSKSVDNPMPDIQYSLSVIAAAETVRSTDIVPIYSESSDTVVFTLTSVGIGEISTQAVVRSLGNGRVAVDTPEAVNVAIYDLAGRCIYNGEVSGNRTIDTLTSGMVIVKIGNTAKKMAL